MENIFLESDSPNSLSDIQIMDALSRMLSFYSHYKIKKVLILPPDITRLNSYAGSIVKMLCDLLPCAVDIMPALGTHMPMTSDEISKMYPGVPEDMFLAHNWRSDVVEIGQIPAQFVAGISEGRMKTPVTVEINRRLLDLNYDLVFSVGQVVPHEVVGMSNFNKNIFVGCGGSSIINSSHYLGALYGMERMMGRDNTPVHKLFDYAEQHFAMNIPIIYIMTVTTSVCDKVRVHSLAIGRDRELFAESIRVSQLHNLTFLEKPLKKVVVYLDPEEFRTTWLGNKAIYRTRMAMADAGELIIVAPGVYRCGEDIINDAVIKKYGYLGRDKILELTNAHEALSNNLSVAAHLIHGSSDGRFKITYAPGQMTREEIEEIGFAYMPIKEAMERFDIKALENGFNVVDGEEIFFVNNPAIGLWAEKARFYND